MNNKIQHILWDIAGAEREIIEKCPTDHKKFAAVGATILMTAVIAFFAGMSAAWYFTQSGDEKSGNFLGSLVFGLLWATLIFTIDRSLVITLKKNPTLKKQKWVVPFVSRAALAVLIAFMVSIPLELFVFHGLISEQTALWENSTDSLTQVTSVAYKSMLLVDRDIDSNDSTQQRLEKSNNVLRREKTSIESQIQQQKNKLNNPISTRYKQACTDYYQANKQIQEIEQNVTKGVNDDARLAQLKKNKSDAAAIKSEELRKWNEPINKELERLNAELGRKTKAIDRNDTLIGNLVSVGANLQEEKQKHKADKDTLLKKHSVARNESNHFIRDFRILEWSVKQPDHGMDLVFLWMIRLLFFIIEILPTVVKIVTPVGSYDWEIHSREDSVIQMLQSDEYKEHVRKLHELEMKAKEDILKQQHDAELEIKKQILEEMIKAQTKVAEAAIAKWEAEQMKGLTSSSDDDC